MFTLPATVLGGQKEGARCRRKGRPVASESGISEDHLIQVWEQLPSSVDLITEDNEPIRLIYPGRGNDDRGADLRDAVITTNGGLLKGDIEFHLWSSDWKRHRHHQNPAYNRTILHAVMWRDTEPVTYLQNGQSVPVLVLNKHLRSAAGGRMGIGHGADAFSLPCYRIAKSMPTERTDQILDAAGRKRFLAKAMAFQGELSRDTPEQVLYRGIMGALGYSKNKLPFQELARRVPLQCLEAIARRHQTDDHCLSRQQALLLGTAGLLPSQRGMYDPAIIGDHRVELLEGHWTEYDKGQAMSANDWHLVKVRPNNFPVRRIASISYLILRYRKEGVLEESLRLITKMKADQACLALEAAMIVMASGYWKTYYDFGCYSIGIAPALIGNGRAADIAVNIILPFACAWGGYRVQTELAARSMAVFTAYPRTSGNAIERHMSRQLGRHCVPVTRAQRQQGLIHIYKAFCTQGKCAVCPLGT
jgi:hypothetical protein